MRLRGLAYCDVGADCEVHENTDPRSGTEKGLYCPAHQDAVMGRHPKDPGNARLVG